MIRLCNIVLLKSIFDVIVKVDSQNCPKSVRQCQLPQPGQTETLRHAGEEPGTIGSSVSAPMRLRSELGYFWPLLPPPCQTSLGSSTPKLSLTRSSFLVVCFFPAPLRNICIRFPGNMESGLLPQNWVCSFPRKRVPPKPFIGSPSSSLLCGQLFKF